MGTINETLLKQISIEQGISLKQIKTVLDLLEEGNTVPFIARYRKEQTGALDEEQIRAVSKEYEYGQNLKKRKDDVLRLIAEKGKLTEELKQEVLKCTKLTEVEDLYRPYKEKKKTRATEAKKHGLEPLAIFLKSYPVVNIELEAEKYLNEEIKDIESALQGAMDIIAEEVADNPKYRKFIKNNFRTQADLTAKATKKVDLDEKGVYTQYYDYSEPIKNIVPHRVLAMNRGESEKILRITIAEDKDTLTYFLKKDFIKKESNASNYLESAIEDAYKRLIKPSVEREIRSELKEVAEEQAIKIFSENLHNLLLQPPMKDKVVLGVDPAYRTGCKLSVLDSTGKVLEIGVIYPHQKYIDEKINPRRILDAKEKVVSMTKKYAVDIIAIGNGTASRETERFIADLIKEYELNVSYVIINEAGASVYSASDNARKEFPDFEVEERSAVSIGRRLQDPLSELVKIDPKSIGVGQYQHDVSQKKLNDQLNFVVETAVNKVGVNINTASQELLQYISGLSKVVAGNIVKYRDEFGKFISRKNIGKVPKLGPKSLVQAVGFLRVLDGKEPLDKTGIHPESYEYAEEILSVLGFSKSDIGSKELIDSINSTDREKLLEAMTIDEYTFNDILDALIAPNRDPRDEFEAPVLKQGVLKLSDISVGMELTGTVRNVVDFGAFVDCGVKEDGLVHISKLTNKFVKHPMDVVQVGQIVKVWVHDIDMKRGRLSLTMINPSK
ncbi:RNA-binding transcriptional accessory protein [Mycoplasmatota bacterium]|nr:RNA-binding transcriptional accessory protein [Mycoplasmatota bacterium]